MLEILEINPSNLEDGALVQVGPIGDGLTETLRVPAYFTRNAKLQGGIEVLLECEFSGQRYEIKSLSVKSGEGYISSRDLTQLGLPRIIRKVGEEIVPRFEFWTAKFALNSPLVEDLVKSDRYLAQVYWLHHIIYGTPRLEITNLLQVSKSTTNVRMRFVGKRFVLPRENPEHSFSATASKKKPEPVPEPWLEP